MPQMNPKPWMYIFMITWVIFLTVIPNKILAHIFPEEAAVTVKKDGGQSSPWSWGWY
nr:ATP synthase F0 subunit 8 [Melanonus zugmayeri]